MKVRALKSDDKFLENMPQELMDELINLREPIPMRIRVMVMDYCPNFNRKRSDVIGEDENGKMVELDPKQVLSIPRRLKSQEVVNHGFMNNFLFANISNIFNAPDEVKEILNGFVIAREDKSKKRDTIVNDANDVNVD